MAPKAKEIQTQEHLHALRGAAAEVGRVIGDDSAEVPARPAESPIESATPMSSAMAAVQRRIEGIDREMLSLEKRRMAAIARWEMSSADFYANAQEKLLAYRRELVALIEKAKKL
jgi:hypothetical protein